MFFKTVTTSKDFALKHGLSHQTVLKAIERMKTSIKGNPSKYRDETYVSTNITPSEHVVNNRKHFCYNLSVDAEKLLLLHIRSKKVNGAKLQMVRDFHNLTEKYLESGGDNSVVEDMYAAAFIRN